MRHKSLVAKFGRPANQRKALIRSLVISLVEHGRITTTTAKAKELRRHVERAITLGKKNTIHSKRLLMSRYPSVVTVDRIVDQWVPHFQTRPGGYTRIMKVGRRLGDSADLAMIELVDYSDVLVKVTEPKGKKNGKGEVKAKSPKTEKAAKPKKKTPEKTSGGKTAGKPA
jgi:large subunit ribosomal protein L17